MGNCCTNGNSDANNELKMEKSNIKMKKVNAGADLLINEIKNSGKTEDITKIQANFRGHQARKEVD
jgi:hypothetical protein